MMGQPSLMFKNCDPTKVPLLILFLFFSSSLYHMIMSTMIVFGLLSQAMIHSCHYHHISKNNQPCYYHYLLIDLNSSF
jgi:hypothetical protein